MKPLLLVAAGLAVVVLDFREGALDLAFDPVATDGSFDPVWNDELEWAVFAGLLPFAWLAWLLLINSGDRWTFPERGARPSPWAIQRRRRSSASRPGGGHPS